MHFCLAISLGILDLSINLYYCEEVQIDHGKMCGKGVFLSLQTSWAPRWPLTKHIVHTSQPWEESLLKVGPHAPKETPLLIVHSTLSDSRLTNWTKSVDIRPLNFEVVKYVAVGNRSKDILLPLVVSCLQYFTILLNKSLQVQAESHWAKITMTATNYTTNYICIIVVK